MSADHTDHAEQVPAHAFDSPEEVAHAKQHAFQNIWWFVGFLGLIIVTVANYEFSSSNDYKVILFLAAIRSLTIAFFLHWLFSSFSLVFRTLTFTIVFLCGMIFLSWWDSTLPHVGDPIKDYHDKSNVQP